MIRSPELFLPFFVLVALAGARVSAARRAGFLVFSNALLLSTMVSPLSGATLAGSSLLVYFLARAGTRTRSFLPAAAGLVLLLGQLVFWKALAGHSARAVLANEPLRVLFPLGISYFTFRLAHYLIDSFRGFLPPHTFADYGAYMVFAPTFLAGPINRFPEFLEDLRRPNADGRVAWGTRRMVLGFAKKVLLVDTLLLEIIPAPSSLETFLALSSRTGLAAFVVLSGLRIYADLSAYSDMAIGAAALCGIRAPENFDNPFLKSDVSRFWRSWHMSLTAWVRDYVFFPFFGLTRRPVVGMVIALTFVGLWHGLTLNWLCWGLYNGILLGVWFMYQGVKQRTPLLKIWDNKTWYRALSWGLTVTSLFAGFSFVVIPDLPNWFFFLQRMLSGGAVR